MEVTMRKVLLAILVAAALLIVSLVIFSIARGQVPSGPGDA